MDSDSRALTDPQVRRLAALRDAAARRRFFTRHRRLVHAGTVEQLAEAVRERVRVNVDEAAALADAALLIAGKLHDDEALARACRAKANAHWFLSECQRASELFDRAAALFEATGNQVELGRTLSSSIQPLILLGQYTRAQAAAERARAIFTANGDDHRLARLDINVANIFHRQDRFTEALEQYERAYERLLPFRDIEGIGATLHNMAVCLISLNDLPRAMAAYERARAHCDQADLPRLVAQADYNIAYLHYFRGDYSRALEMLRVSRQACRDAGDDYHSALCQLDQSDIYLELNLSTEAAETAQEAQTEFERLGMGYEAARSLANLAIATGQLGEPFRSLELLDHSRARFVREENAAWPAVIDLYKAILFHNEGRIFEARRLCVDALAAFRQARLARRSIVCELLLARLDLRANAFSAAHERCTAALDHLKQVEAPVLEYQAYFLRGQIHEATGEAAAAYEAYQQARSGLESLRGVLWGEELKIAFLHSKVEVYERLVALCMERPADARVAEETFGYMEQAKSRTLRDLFSERLRPIPAPGVGQSDLVRQIRSLREELNWYYHRVELEQLNRDDRSPERLNELQAQLHTRERTFIRVLREMPSAERESLGLQSTPVATLQDLQAALGPADTLVEYFRTGDRIVAAVLTAGELVVLPLTTATRAAHLLRLMQFQLSKFQFGPKLVAAAAPRLEVIQAHLHELYKELVAPLPLQPGGRLIVVPHEELHCVPFHALFDGRDYLIDRYQVSFAPSASIYRLCERRPSAAGGSLILGVPDARAPFILEEVESVADALGGADVRIGADATIAALRDAGAASRIVHVATHGYFRKDNPLFSGVRLGDSFLTLHDLYALRLPVDLMTLSGCATGLTVVAGGDELRGLVRGLFAAGVRSALVTLWDVNDRSTAMFMKTFYRRLRTGADRGQALQHAARTVRATHPHPYFWAPFVLVGALSSGGSANGIRPN